MTGVPASDWAGSEPTENEPSDSVLHDAAPLASPSAGSWRSSVIVPGLQPGGLADGATQAPIRNPTTNTTAATATRPAHCGRLTSHQIPATTAMTIASRTGIAASSAAFACHAR